MLIAGVLKFDPQGRIILSAGPPLDFNGGTPIGADGGLSAAAGATPNLFLAAIGYLTNGALTDSDNPLTPHSAPITNDQGQVRISFGLPAYYYAGLPLTAEGFLSISDGVVPPVIGPGAFDQGFDNAFDNGSP
jgi:hypothetical protein